MWHNGRRFARNRRVFAGRVCSLSYMAVVFRLQALTSLPRWDGAYRVLADNAEFACPKESFYGGSPPNFSLAKSPVSKPALSRSYLLKYGVPRNPPRRHRSILCFQLYPSLCRAAMKRSLKKIAAFFWGGGMVESVQARSDVRGVPRFAGRMSCIPRTACKVNFGTLRLLTFLSRTTTWSY